jgi:hypothetical protein
VNDLRHPTQPVAAAALGIDPDTSPGCPQNGDRERGWLTKPLTKLWGYLARARVVGDEHFAIFLTIGLPTRTEG